MSAVTIPGFHETQTGGGCTALRLDLIDHRYILVTDEDGAEAPTTETKGYGVGLYTVDDVSVDFESVKTLDEAMKVIARFVLSKPDGVTGQRIKRVRSMTRIEMQNEGWAYGRRGQPTVIELENGTILYASRDEEGNGPGALFAFDPKTKKSFGFGG